MTGVEIGRKDIAAMALFSLIFLSLASFNVGFTRTPITSWQASMGDIVYLTLDSNHTVNSVYLLIDAPDGLSFNLYSNGNGRSSLVGFFHEEGYYHWSEIDVNLTTNQLIFDFGGSAGKIYEIVVTGDSNVRLDIKDIEYTGQNEENVRNLIDEQEYFENPPTFRSETYFDEIYFVRAAQDYLESREQYEWTHPPLGKLILASGILAFGFSTFGWRVMGVLFAALMIPLIYVLAKLMFGNTLAASTSAFLLTFDFLHLTMSRIATVDTFLVFFTLVSCIFFYINYQRMSSEGKTPSFKLILLGTVFSSLALSVKWNALYGLIGQIFIIFFLIIMSSKNARIKMKIKLNSMPVRTSLMISISLLIGGLIYLSTYIPYILIGHDLRDVYLLQWRMYEYHSSLNVSHPFSSVWWMWLLDVRPLWMYVKQLPGGLVSTITAMGNPMIWWIGLSSMILAVWTGIKRGSRQCLFIGSIYLFQLLPYVFITRPLFIYHYYPSVPILILGLTWLLAETWKKTRGKLLVKLYLIAVLVAFVLFYPVISGYTIPLWYRESLRWFRSWAF